MKLLKHLGSIAAGAILGMSLVASASAAETLKFGLCYDLSKTYTFVTPQITQGARDLADLVNLNGGIAGHPVELVIRDHGNEPQRGIECYERMKREGIFIFDTMSTPVSIALIPRLMKDGNILLQSLVGRGDAVDGTVFTNVFPIGPTYWGQAANMVDYVRQAKGTLKDAKIAFFYIDYPFGQEPIGVLKTLAEKEGFELGLFPIPLPGNDQGSTWTQIRRFNPDYIISWAFAGMHVVASREMKRNGIPIEKYISVNWLNEHDIASIGPENAIGLKRSTSLVGGTDIPIIQEIIAELYDKGRGNGNIEDINDVYYNTGVAVYSAAFEGARLAIEKHGWPVTAETFKDGLESIREFDANGLIAPISVTPEDHGSGGFTRIDMWDGEKWVGQTDWFSAYNEVVWDIIKESSAQFKANE